MGPQHGSYSVQLDGGQAVTYNGTAFLPFYGVTLFHADSLVPGNHELIITNLPNTDGSVLSIDYALVSSVARYLSINRAARSALTFWVSLLLVLQGDYHAYS